MSEPDFPEEGYGLVMPFVVIESQGGSYKDDAFVAGVRFQQDRSELEAAPHIVEWANYVFPSMVPQYDLLAMHLGFTMTAEPWEEHPGDWVLVTFRRGDDEGPDEVHP
jgi:hypothetical protein